MPSAIDDITINARSRNGLTWFRASFESPMDGESVLFVRRRPGSIGSRQWVPQVLSGRFTAAKDQPRFLVGDIEVAPDDVLAWARLGPLAVQVTSWFV